MTDHGSDFRLADDDIIFTPDGDAELISGPACAAQDIDQALKITIGRLYWDKEVGSTMPLMLNDSAPDMGAIAGELQRVAIADMRVNPETVKAYEITPGKFRLEFTPLGAVKPETLDYDLTKGREANAG
jgi:hypothetical protein